eukprot:1689233-Pyramimonas_sp.AAC.2
MGEVSVKCSEPREPWNPTKLHEGHKRPKRNVGYTAWPVVTPVISDGDVQESQERGSGWST